MSKYYRGKFMIGVYNLLHEGETCVGLCDNVREFAKYLKVKEPNARMILQNLFTGATHYIKVNGKIRTVAFINVEED